MKYEKATDKELEKKLAKLTTIEEKGEYKILEFNGLWIGGECPKFCSSWDATMHLAVKHGLDIELAEEWLGNVGTITKHMQYGTDIQVDFTNTDNPLRSIVICLIKVLESKQ